MNEINDIIGRTGLPPGAAFDPDGIVAALVVIAVGLGLGALVRRGISAMVRRIDEARPQLIPDGIADHAAAIAGAVAALLLLIPGRVLIGNDALASLLVAGAIGLTVGYLVFNLMRALGPGRRLSAVAAIIALVASVAAALGGLQPLVDALDEARVGVGKYEVSLLGIVNALFVLLLLYAAARLSMRFIGRWLASAPQLDSSQQVLSQKLLSLVIVVVSIFIGIDMLGIDLTALAVFSGALGLAIGFGMQKTLGNLLSGIILLMDRSIKPGDVIVVGDTFGWVNKIGIRAVSVLTRDGKEYLIPNETLMTETVENWSYSDRNVRVRIPVGISYDSDVHRARTLMLDAVENLPRVLKEPRPVVNMSGFGDSSVDFEIRIWITDAEAGLGNITSEVLFRVWDLFKAEGIEIPYPQRDVHIRTMDESLKPLRAPSEAS